MSRSIVSIGLAALLVAVAVPAFAQQDAMSGCTKAKSSKFDDYSTVKEPGPDHPDRVRYTLTGDVMIVCDDSRLFADRVEWTNDSDWVYAKGHVFLQQLNLRISAESAMLDRKTHLGTFEQVSGTIQMNEKKTADQFGGVEPDAIFSGTTLEKIGPKTYRLKDGEITTCTQPTPRWEMSSTEATITPGEHVLMRNMVLKLKDVPLFYLPVIYYPISKEGRSTGFLMPSYGSSTFAGFHLSNAFFWAINRSQDATVYHDLYTKTGQGYGSEYRYISAPGSQGNVEVSVLDQKAQTGSDGTTISPAEQSYTLRGGINQALPYNLRLVGSANYFTSVQAQQTYQQNLFDLSQRNSSLSAQVSGQLGQDHFDVTVDESDLYTGAAPAQRTGHAPQLDFSVPQKPIGRSRVYYGFQAQATNFINIPNVDDPTTNLGLWREDFTPMIKATVSSLAFLNVTTSATFEFTAWSQRLDPTTLASVPEPIYRELFIAEADVVGPSFDRVLHTNNHYAEAFRHAIEPSVSIIWKSPFANLDQIVKNDYQVDENVGGTTNVAYGVTNHLFAKRKAADGQEATSEILTIKLNQTYASNALATAYDPAYVSNVSSFIAQPAPTNFSPVQLAIVTAPTTGASAQFTLDYDAHFRAVRDYATTATLHGRLMQLSLSWVKDNVIPALAALGQGWTVPTHSINSTFRYQPPDHHLGGLYLFNYDIENKVLDNQRIEVFYNSQCCGLVFDYQSIGAIGGLPSDHRFGFSFSLAGLGSFSNPFGSFGG